MKKDNTMWRMEFARRLRASMDTARMSATELSKRTGVGKTDISNYRSGRYMPKQDRTYIMAVALGVDPVWLYALDVKYAMESGEVLQALPEGTNDIVSVVPWNPDEMGYADNEEDDYRIMARGMRRMTPENRQKLIGIAKMLFAEDFDEEGNKK